MTTEMANGDPRDVFGPLSPFLHDVPASLLPALSRQWFDLGYEKGWNAAMAIIRSHIEETRASAERAAIITNVPAEELDS